MDDSLLSKLLEEFVRKIRCGNAPDPEVYAALYPQFAERIREIFPTLLLLENAAAGAPDPANHKSVATSGRPDRKLLCLHEDTEEDPFS